MTAHRKICRWSRLRRRTVGLCLLAVAACLVVTSSLSPAEAQLAGPLRVNPGNPRYFTDNSGKSILLAGSHTWANRVDNGFLDPPAPFDYAGYLDFLQANNHNFCTHVCDPMAADSCPSGFSCVAAGGTNVCGPAH